MSPNRSSKKFQFSLQILAIAILTACALNADPSVSIEPTVIVLTETPLPPFILHIPDKALWRNYLHISLEAPAGTDCKLTYIAPMGAMQEMDTTANENGLCEWRLKISEEEGKGHSRLIFTVNGVSETHFIDVRPNF